MTTSVLLPSFDRLVELVPGERAVAVRNVPGTLPVFATHFPRHPVLPGVLLLESMTALAKAAAGDGGSWRLRAVRGVRFKHFVGPGDQVEITVDVTGRGERLTELRAVAKAGGRVVATARTLALEPVRDPWEGTA
ncbi:3-hydroxyacyl-ACP dehydratase FabZ family protein [Streptomyces capillispiralis]|uniref:3-hydroxyacyl-[acyl-carrier-protein] dehydratase n=1 Tax=Streptomyces capillispiralis TaxID=68182 RepID=A0A561TCC9_9ACTN|nr:hydroxymyristoyl-ACP dehydratase [Streptomyces capillispiralis]TWF84762.1 3-hydroxyacyl-[acyl-carrier-protein] dehydratase [Streptomyces capillispiralis]GHH96133.1 3-hydroxyacyl-[acyl-carrier-protein] dehydratase FabZ [Streptomyces capillispiralis]